MQASSGDLAESVRGTLERHPRASRYLLAFSGGLDSSVLLHVMARLRVALVLRLEAAHVNHGLHPEAAAWEELCARRCASEGVVLYRLRVDARSPAGESPEAWARRRRYASLAALIAPGDCLVTAHQGDDQVETLLLQLIRGAGPHGLAAMAEYDRFGRGALLRPLLGEPRSRIAAYASKHALEWIDDPGNADRRFERNFIRAEILAPLLARRPGAATAIRRAARWQAEAATALEALAEADLRAIAEGRTLHLTGLAALDPVRQRNALRHWVRGAGAAMPGACHVEQILECALAARADAQVQIRWRETEVRRYRDRLYLMRALPATPAGYAAAWEKPAELRLPGGTLLARPASGRGVDARLWADEPPEIRFRQGGERARLPGRRHHAELKKLMQQAGIPPWERTRIPLVFSRGRLAAVAGLWVFEPFAAAAGRPGFLLEWLPDPPLKGCGYES
jgi:tRNA(Ile)-lysidine synthase